MHLHCLCTARVARHVTRHWPTKQDRRVEVDQKLLPMRSPCVVDTTHQMYWYLSFLRPPPVSAALGEPVVITPQVANDLRTE